jgi:hypothetical protein
MRRLQLNSVLGRPQLEPHVKLTTCPLVVAALLSSGCKPGPVDDMPSPATVAKTEIVSLAAVIAKPREYHNRRIRVVGFCHLEFEGNGLYVQSADFHQGVTKHGVWLDVEDSPETRALSDEYVVVQGRFDAEQRGHLSMFSGLLTDVTRIEASSSP